MRRVVVTGMGIVSPLGTGVETTWSNMLAGKSGAGTITRFDASDLPSRIAFEVKEGDGTNGTLKRDDWIDPKDQRRYDDFIQFALVAAKQAMKDSGGDYDRFIARLDAAIAKIVLTQTMTTDNGSSLSQAQIHYKVGQATAKSDADLICESFVKSIATWLTEWNFPGAKVPTVYRDFGEAVDLAQTAARDQALAAIGWRPTAERVREVYGEGYEYSPPVAQGPMFGEARFAEPLPGGHDAVDDLLTNGWERVIGPEVADLERILGECHTLEQFRDRLGDLARRSPTQLADALARARFVARAAGNAEAETDDGPEAT